MNDRRSTPISSTAVTAVTVAEGSPPSSNETSPMISASADFTQDQNATISGGQRDVGASFQDDVNGLCRRVLLDNPLAGDTTPDVRQTGQRAQRIGVQIAEERDPLKDFDSDGAQAQTMLARRSPKSDRL